MKYIRYAFLALLAVVLVTVALANRQMVTLRLLPETMGGFLGWSWEVTLPLFMVILAGILAGLLVGFVWEWLREHKHRAEARRQRREKEALAREVEKARRQPAQPDDEVLALLENPRPAR